MRLPVGITALLIAVAIIVLVVTDARDSDDTLAGNGAPQEDPAASPWLALPEWVASSPEALIEFYYEASILDVQTDQIWHVTAPGRVPRTQGSPIEVGFLTWTAANEALIGVSGDGRTALHIGLPGGDLRYWTTVDGSDLGRTQISWSPDGTLLAIGESIIDADTGIVITGIPLGSRIGWSADSRFFAVAIASEESPSVIAWDRETGAMEEIPLATSGVWSALGHRLAYAPERPAAAEPRLNQILVVDVPGGANDAVSVLSELRGYDATPVAWSSGGDYLVVEVSTRPVVEGGFREYHIVTVDTGETSAVIEGAWPPAWSPADDVLLFTGNICSGFDIFTVQADGTALTNHTVSDSLDLWPIWSPDGESLLHVNYGEDAVVLVETSVVPGTRQTILSLPRDALYPGSWSPAGEYVTFRWGGGRGLCESGTTELQETKVRLPE